MHIHIDFETYSDLDVTEVGAYRYAEHPSTEVLICCWAIDDAPVQTWLPWRKPPPAALLAALERGATLCAHNAQFERAVWEGRLRRRHAVLPATRPEQWVCTAALAAVCSLPRKLEKAALALRLPHKKDARGGRLIRMFSGPRKPTKGDPRTRLLPADDPAAFREFIEYCRGDVEVERDLHRVLPPLSPKERRLFVLDTIINERGIPIDMPLVHKAKGVLSVFEQRMARRVVELTGYKPTQVARVREWAVHKGADLPNLKVKTVETALLRQRLPADVREVLELRRDAGKVSTKKLDAMLRVVGRENRARGTILFHGAHTGRWSGKLIQPHNFVRGLLSLRAQARVFKLLALGDPDVFDLMYDRPLSIISQCMRGFICAEPGWRLIVVDYSAIEARVLSWLANDTVMLEAFRQGKDVYIEMAAFLYGIKSEDVTDEQRRIAKNLVLGCGFGLGAFKFVEYCANAGLMIEEELATRGVKAYRERHFLNVRYWGDVERAAAAAIRNPTQTVRLRNVAFAMWGHYLTITLPSGRKLYYPYARVEPAVRFGRPTFEISFKTEEKGQWVRRTTYGGKLVENIVQAVARDFMAAGMLHAEAAGYPLIGTVHDELISHVAEGQGSAKELEQVVSRVPLWGAGCPIAAKGFEAQRYRKD